MPRAEAFEPQFAVDTMMSVLNERLLAATPVEELSRHSDRVLQVFEEPNGSQFVRRDFTEEGVDYVERAGLDFQEAWEAMHDLYADVGIEVIPSFMFQRSGESDEAATVVSEYAPDLVDVNDLGVEEKVKLVQGLGSLLDPGTHYWPSLEAVRADTFKGVKQEDGTHKLIVVDTDPLVIRAPQLGRDGYVGEYIKKFSALLWDDWCEDDRVVVATALVMSLADSLNEDEIAGMGPASRAFMDLHLMSNGMDPRGMGA